MPIPKQICVFTGTLSEGVAVDNLFYDQMRKWGYRIDLFSYQQARKNLLDACSLAVLIYLGGSSIPQRNKENLIGYLEQGGSILLFGDPRFYIHHPFEKVNDFLSAFGAEILDEVIEEENEECLCQQRKMYQLVFGLTTNIAEDPITQSVEKICYPYLGMEGSRYTFPLKVSDDWKVLLRASRSASSPSYPTAPPIMALRSIGRGKLVILSSFSSFWIEDAYHRAWGGYIYNVGDGLQLIKNTFDALAISSDKRLSTKVGFPIVKTESLENPVVRRKKKIYRGLIGAATQYSGHSYTVEEFCKEAKRCGYDFIVFAEDFEKLTEKDWESLKLDCKEESNETFLALPGLALQDAYGNKGIYFGSSGLFPNRKVFKNTGFVHIFFSLGNSQGPPVLILSNPHLNPWPPWHIKFYSGIEVFTYQDNRLIDDSSDWYKALQASYYHLLPVSCHRVIDPKAIGSIKGFQTYVLATSTGDILTSMGKKCVDGFISNGPLIKQFEVKDLVKDPWLSYRYWKAGEPIAINIQASSDVEVTEVRLYRKTKIIRRFRPNTAIFKTTVEEVASQDGPYLLEVIDSNGNRAVSSSLLTRNREYQSQMCADLQNTILSMPDPQGDSAVYHSTFINGWEVWGPRAALPGKELFPPGLDIPIGGGMHTLGTDPVVFRKDGVEHLIPDRKCVFASEDCVIYENFYYTRCSVESSLFSHNPYHYRYMSELKELSPSQYVESKVRYVCFRPRIGSFNMILIEIETLFTQNVELAEREGLEVILLNPSGKVIVRDQRAALKFRRYPRYSYIGRQNRKCSGETRFSQNEVTLVAAELGRKGYVSIWPDEFGSFAVFALDDKPYSISIGGVWGADREDIAVGYKMSGEKVPAGTKWHDRFMFILDNGKVPQDSTFHRFYKLYGFEEESAYKVTLENGEPIDHHFFLTLRARDYYIRGEIAEANLPNDLGIMVKGLNPNWDAGFYDTDNKELKRIGVFENTAYLVISTSTSRRFFAGNLLTCENPEIGLALIRKDQNALEMEVHNPLEQAVNINIKSPLFQEIGIPVSVTAGASKRIRCEVADENHRP